MSPTGKSFRVVHACVRAVECLVRSRPNFPVCRFSLFPFRRFWSRRVFPFPLARGREKERERERRERERKRERERADHKLHGHMGLNALNRARHLDSHHCACNLYAATRGVTTVCAEVVFHLFPAFLVLCEVDTIHFADLPPEHLFEKGDHRINPAQRGPAVSPWAPQSHEEHFVVPPPVFEVCHLARPLP